jgi:2-keto-4-pentenoate hydratase/2-oxohepta-3-ene-1,7-dioic acid hydratase in catechol pathway
VTALSPIAVNGDLRQRSDTSLMLFDVPALLRVVNRAMSLRAGDVIATGTPAGVGAGMDPKGFLKRGDTCEVTVEGVGVLKNRVA